jgi:hypothetical protein
MNFTRFFNRVTTIGFVIVLLAGSSVIARDQDDRKDRSSQSSRSSNSGGGSSRSAPSGQSSSSGSNSVSRTFSSRGDQSSQVQSFDRSSRSSGDSSHSGSWSGRVYDGRSSAGRSSDGASSIIRSFGNQTGGRSIESLLQNRDGGTGSSVVRGSTQGSASSGAPADRNSTRSGNGSNDSSQSNRFSKNADYSAQYNKAQAGGDNSNSSKRGYAQSQNQSGDSQSTGNTFRSGNNDSRVGRSQWSRPFSQDASARPTKEKVDEFLQLRRDDSTKTVASASGRTFDGKVTRTNGEMNFGRNAIGNAEQNNLQSRILDSKKNSDQAWVSRFGNPNGAKGGRWQSGNAANRNDEKKNAQLGQLGNSRRPNDVQGIKHSLDRGLIDRNYQDWRKSASGDGHGKIADHRDWSGQWKNGDRFVAAADIRDHWNGHHDHNDRPFGNDWWRRHGNHNGHWGDWDRFGHHHDRPFFWWDWCSAPRLGTWITFDYRSPFYWDYGPGEYIFCNDGVVFVNGVWFEPAPTFYQRTLVLAQRAPIWTPQQFAQVEWLPLGVFVVARDGVADNNVMVQLAVTGDGVIGGTIFNQLTGATFDIAGNVDKQSQRAVWTYVDNTGARIVMESSIFNLTQPEATGLIHYGPDNMQVIELVRLEQPNSDT